MKRIAPIIFALFMVAGPALGESVALNQLQPRGTPQATDQIPILPAGASTLQSTTVGAIQAAATPPATHKVDFRPFFNGVVFPVLAAVLAPLVTGFALYALRKIAALAHINISAHQAAVVESAMQNGISYALSKANTLADAHGVLSTKSSVIADAANYALPKIGPQMTALGLTPEGIAQRIEARLPPQIQMSLPAAA